MLNMEAFRDYSYEIGDKMNRLTTAEVAAQLGITERRVRQLAAELGIEPERIGKAIFFSPAQIKLMKKRKTQRGPEKKGKKQ